MKRETLLGRRNRRANVVSIFMLLLVSCKTKTHEPVEGVRQVVIDLNKMAPIGYEICAEHPPKLAAADVNLQLQMPERFTIPPDQRDYGAASVEFKPGLHEVDLYKSLGTARLLHARGDLTVENGVHTIRVKLDMAKLPKGRYVLGISGEPFFAYCTVELK